MRCLLETIIKCMPETTNLIKLISYTQSSYSSRRFSFKDAFFNIKLTRRPVMEKQQILFLEGVFFVQSPSAIVSTPGDQKLRYFLEVLLTASFLWFRETLMWYCKTLLDYVEKKVPIESFTSTKFCDIEKMNIIENL